jgi:hypothetical protein
MFEQLVDQQPLADAIQKTIKNLPSARIRKTTLTIINNFEALDWIPLLFEDIAEELGFGGLEIEEGRVFYDPPSNDPIETCEAVQELLLAYTRRVLPDPMGSKEAAAYLGLTWDGLKHYLHREGTLRGMKIGHSLVFTKSALDEFDSSRRAAGRPPGS